MAEIKEQSQQQAVESSTNKTVDAQTGFHDIKPLPEFHPFNPWPIFFVLFCALLLGLYLLLKRRWQKKPTIAPTPILSPHDEALKAFAELEESRISRLVELRELSTRLSYVLRHYLERSFRFPAREQTCLEISRNLPEQIKTALPTIPKERQQEFIHNIRSQLKLWERISFADNSEQVFRHESSELEHSIDSAVNLVKNLAYLLKKEEDRVRGVLNNSNPTTKDNSEDNVVIQTEQT